jgi:hypothetical protein
MTGWADLQILERLQDGPAVFQAAAKLAGLNFLLARVPVQSACGDAKILCGFGMLQPSILGSCLGRNWRRRGRTFRSVISNSRQCFAQELNDLLGIPRLEHHTRHDSWIAGLSFSGCVAAVVHPTSNRLLDYSQMWRPIEMRILSRWGTLSIRGITRLAVVSGMHVWVCEVENRNR